MAYTKNDPIWAEGVAPGISAARLNHLEEQYDEAAADDVIHAALDTGVHGAGASTLATEADIATHAALVVHLVSGLIVMWHGTIANIPAGWVICDGNNGTPNLLTRFVEGVATAATNPGTTGGATAKTTTGHVHSQGATGGPSATGDRETGAAWSRPYVNLNHTHSNPNVNSNTDSIADIRPKFYDVAFLMKT